MQRWTGQRRARRRGSPKATTCWAGAGAASRQAAAVAALGGLAIQPGGDISPEVLATLDGISAAIWWGDSATGAAHARALASRKGEIVALLTAMPGQAHVAHERHLCVDTTAAGGNGGLLAG